MEMIRLKSLSQVDKNLNCWYVRKSNNQKYFVTKDAEGIYWFDYNGFKYRISSLDFLLKKDWWIKPPKIQKEELILKKIKYLDNRFQNRKLAKNV